MNYINILCLLALSIFLSNCSGNPLLDEDPTLVENLDGSVSVNAEELDKEKNIVGYLDGPTGKLFVLPGRQDAVLQKLKATDLGQGRYRIAQALDGTQEAATQDFTLQEFTIQEVAQRSAIYQRSVKAETLYNRVTKYPSSGSTVKSETPVAVRIFENAFCVGIRPFSMVFCRPYSPAGDPTKKYGIREIFATVGHCVPGDELCIETRKLLYIATIYNNTSCLAFPQDDPFALPYWIVGHLDSTGYSCL